MTTQDAGESFILAIDASTTSVRALLFDKAGSITAESAVEFEQHYPEAGWVEHDPNEIWTKVLRVARESVALAGIHASQVAAIGIANQRETVVGWNKATGEPIMNAIVWQDRRTAETCAQIRSDELDRYVHENTGLVIDSYFSATKIRWMLDHVPGATALAQRGEIAFGTIDSWLIWNLTGRSAHVTDVSNASRTLLFNINTFEWDQHLLDTFGVPLEALPRVGRSSEIYGHTAPGLFDGHSIPVASAAGDQQAALFGQACFEAGMVKCTYGTGASLMMNTGSKPVFSKNGLLTTVACQVGDRRQYALEGLIFVSAAVVQWLRDEIKLISSADETESIAMSVQDSDGVYLVPAFAGLGAPYWDNFARGTIVGMTLRTNRAHVVRAALESICYPIRESIDAMSADSSIDIARVRVDGGACRNNFIMQFQADLLGVEVSRPVLIETTSRGAAYLAGLAVGFWASVDELQTTFAVDARFSRIKTADEVAGLFSGWKRAVERSRRWVV